MGGRGARTRCPRTRACGIRHRRLARAPAHARGRGRLRERESARRRRAARRCGAAPRASPSERTTAATTPPRTQRMPHPPYPWRAGSPDAHHQRDRPRRRGRTRRGRPLGRHHQRDADPADLDRSRRSHRARTGRVQRRRGLRGGLPPDRPRDRRAACGGGRRRVREGRRARGRLRPRPRRADGRAHRTELRAADVGHRDSDGAIRRRGRAHRCPHRRHPQDHPGTAGVRTACGGQRRRAQSPLLALGRRDGQRQSPRGPRREGGFGHGRAAGR